MENTPFLPAELSNILKNIAHRFIGLCVFFVGLLILFALLIHPEQNLFNVATTVVHQKSIIKIFYYCSDFLTQNIGWIATFIICCVLIRYAYQMILNKESNTNSDIRFISIFLSVFFVSMAFNLIFYSSAIGGLIGVIVSNDLYTVLPKFVGIILGFGLLLCGFYFSILALDFNFEQVKSFILSCYKYTNISIKWIIAKLSNRHISIRDELNDEVVENVKEDKKQIKNENVSNKKMVKQSEHVEHIEQKPVESVKKLVNTVNNFLLPPLSFLKKGNITKSINSKYHKQTAELLKTNFAQFGILGEITKINPGPVITLYEFEPAAGITVSSIISKTTDIARATGSLSVRIATIPGSTTIGIEIPNSDRQTVYFQGLVADDKFQNSKYKIPLILGQDIGGENIYADLAKMPHLLVAGRTGAGKSVFMLDVIMSLLYKFEPDKCKMILIDPKKVEFSNWKDIPHLLTPVVTDVTKAINTLKWAVREMDNRYSKMEKLGVNNLTDYNKKVSIMRDKGETKTERVKIGVDMETGEIQYEDRLMDLSNIPLVVIIIDEVAELMLSAKKEVEACIQRLAQLARACGIHLVMATQRPSVDVITGIIKSNLPTRVSFQTTSEFDSRTILGRTGAENLLDKGDMLYISAEAKNPTRIQAPFISPEEAENVANWLRDQGTPNYQMDVLNGGAQTVAASDEVEKMLRGKTDKEEQDEDLYRQAIKVVIDKNQPSISYIQRCLHIGYNKAASFIERMETEGIVSAPGNSGKRTILKN